MSLPSEVRSCATAFEDGIVALTMVKADRAQEFEDWVRSVVVPAVSKQPTFTGRWRVVRAGKAQDPVPYAFQFDGSDIDEFDSAPALVAERGEQRADAEIARFESMLAEEQTLLVFSPPIIQG